MSWVAALDQHVDKDEDAEDGHNYHNCICELALHFINDDSKQQQSNGNFETRSSDDIKQFGSKG